MDAYTYLSSLSDKQLIELTEALNTPMFPEDGIVRQIAEAIYGRNDFIIMNALGMTCILSRVLAERLEAKLRVTESHETY